MSKPAAALVVSEGQRGVLEALSVSRTAPHREVQRARVLLMAADGVANTEIASRLGVTPVTVWSWRERFQAEGMAKFAKVAPGRGRKPQIPQGVIEQIVDLTQNSTPEGETHWSTRTKAIVLCMDEKSSVQALDRTQPSLPMVKGCAATMTHDYKRHGTTTSLFAALNVLTGKALQRSPEDESPYKPSLKTETHH